MANDSKTSKAVLITGCSTGIGRATAERLAGAGHVVYATARRADAIAVLEAAGCRTLALDVTDDASMRAAVECVVAEQGAVGVLVNNAGYSQSGRSRASRSTLCGGSSRPTSSASCGCASSCCPACANKASAGS